MKNGPTLLWRVSTGWPSDSSTPSSAQQDRTDKHLQGPTLQGKISHHGEYSGFTEWPSSGLAWTQVDMVNTSLCLPKSSPSEENFLNMEFLQIKSFNLVGCNRKQDIITSSKIVQLEGLQIYFMLSTARAVQQAFFLGFTLRKQVIKEIPPHV